MGWHPVVGNHWRCTSAVRLGKSIAWQPNVQIAIEDIIGLLGAIGRAQRSLHLEAMAKHREHGLNQIVFGLRLNAAGRKAGVDRPQLGQHRSGLGGERLPISPLRQNLIEIVVGKELLVGVQLGDAKRKLNRRHRLKTPGPRAQTGIARGAHGWYTMRGATDK